MNAYLAPLFQADANSLSPLAMFIQADVVVKLVMLILICAAVWSWGIILSQSFVIGTVTRQSIKFDRSFWQSADIDKFAGEQRGSAHPMAKILSAGLAEWRLSTNGKIVDREGVRGRIATSLSMATATEVDRLADRLNILATVGAVAPFIGLFGTVWGIMRSFSAIAGQQNTSLAVVAPGISEALFATALGLFAAIPAVIGYNRLSHGINRLEARLNRFADGLHATLSRELEQ